MPIELRPVQWLRQRFVTGFFVTVPLAVSVAALVWVFQVFDGLVGPLFDRWTRIRVPGLGILATALLVLVVGTLATNVLFKQALQRAEAFLLRVPVFKTVYSPVKQLIAAFNPENEAGFKRVVLVEHPRGALVLGFLTREFAIDRGRGPEALVAVYVPTNHLYLGDVLVFPRDRVSYPDLTVEQGVRVFLTGGVALSAHVKVLPAPGDGQPREGA
jgi:uncharacterized membrane protein